MAKLKMEFYVASSGVSFTVPLSSEEYRLGKAFLQKLGKEPAYQADQTLPEFYHFENNHEVDAFYDVIRPARTKNKSR